MQSIHQWHKSRSGYVWRRKNIHEIYATVVTKSLLGNGILQGKIRAGIVDGFWKWTETYVWAGVAACLCTHESVIVVFISWGGRQHTLFYFIHGIMSPLMTSKRWSSHTDSIYRQVSNIRRTLVVNQIVDHSDVVGASPVGAAPTTSSFST